MKPILTTIKFLAALALVVMAAGCASNNNLLDKENVAVAAGFKVITPAKPDQLALLKKLPPDKVTPITYGGKPYFVLPDLANNQAYVGGPKQYKVYQRLRQKQISDSTSNPAPLGSYQVVEMNGVEAMDWAGWGGWDGVGGPDGMGWPGWY